MNSIDPLTAEPDAIPRRGPGAPLRLIDVARAFARYDSPKLIGVGFLAALAARVAVGNGSGRDFVIRLGLIPLEPVTEWVIHVYLLHARPIQIGARRHDLLA